MLRNLSDLHGRTLGATDGPIGHVKDFYFDDTSWVVRYVVADTGTWLPGRLVLLPPRVFGDDALGPVDAAPDVLAVDLSRHQIETSPSIDAHRPVSRQTEAAYYSHFGWPAYWPDFGIGVIAGIPAVKLPPSKATPSITATSSATTSTSAAPAPSPAITCRRPMARLAPCAAS